MIRQCLNANASREAEAALQAASPDASLIEVAQVRGRSRMTRCKSISPLKILNPTAIASCCQAYLSSYGGGMVSGDTINIDIACLPKTKFFLGSQAETKIFVSHKGNTCKQNIRGKVAEEALAVVMPDAVVPFANSRFIQKQTWHLKETSEFVLCDWLHEGRSTRGEHFEFSQYYAETSIYVNNEIRILDRIDINTERGDPRALGAFGPYTGMLAMYVVGQKVTEAIRAQVHAATAHNKILKRWVTVNSVDESTLTLRVMSAHKSEITTFVQEIMALFEGKEFLGINPLRRKH